MDSSKVDMFILSKGSLFPNAQLPLLREMLINAKEEDWVKINSAPFKNPATALILSFAVGTYGADRFYLGHYMLGIGKLLLTILFIAWFVVIELGAENWMLVVAGLVLMSILIFWYFIDIFLVTKTAREQN